MDPPRVPQDRIPIQTNTQFHPIYPSNEEIIIPDSEEECEREERVAYITDTIIGEGMTLRQFINLVMSFPYGLLQADALFINGYPW